MNERTELWVLLRGFFVLYVSMLVPYLELHS
jgi:hypothetical protein